jgi:hypothetical protein
MENSMAEPANHEDDIDALIACLGDDASQIRNELENGRPNCEGFICKEWADSMESAAVTIASLCKQLDEARAAPALRAPEPVAYRYKDSRGHWRYVGAPLTSGWSVPPNLRFEPLYGPNGVDTSAQQQEKDHG